MENVKVKNVFILILLLAFFMVCSELEDRQPIDSNNKNDFPDQESWESIITITKEARRVAEVWAGYIAVYNEKEIAVLKDSIYVDFYDQDGYHNSVLTADSGMVFNRTNNLEASGNVVVVSDSGVVLKTEQLRWNNEMQKIESSVQVYFTTDNDTLIGDSFVSDPDLKNYEIRNARGYSGRKIPIKK